ncbi:virion structural protein [Cyanophage S-TIM66]|nr:virion structural protein [Cyanophage S-TIM66]
MALKKIKAHQQPPRSFTKELQLISYAGGSLFNESGAVLLGEKKVYYPKDYSKDGSPAVVTDPDTYKEFGTSSKNKFSKGFPAALPIEEQFPLQSEVSRSLLGVNRAETQQGIFGNVSSYGLDKKDWVAYSFFPDHTQGNHWEFKNSPAGPHRAAINRDDASGSSVVLTSYAVPYSNPGNRVLNNLAKGIYTGDISRNQGQYLQTLIAQYIIAHMVNNFTDVEKRRFNVNYIDFGYPKDASGNFDPLYWDQIWTDIDQSRIPDSFIPSLPLGELRNFSANESDEDNADQIIKINITQAPWNSILEGAEFEEVDVYPGKPFFATTRYTWEEPDKGHYRLKTNNNTELWQEYWGIDYNSLPQDLKDWEFRVLESEPGVNTPEYKYKLPYYLITDKTKSYTSLIFGSDWPKSQSDDRIAQVGNKLTEGNIIGARPSSYAGLFLQSQRAFRYQPGRISGFTYGVRVSEEGAGPGTVLEFGVENFSDGYFFRFKDGTDFSIVRRSTVSLGNTQLFSEARYIEREAFINKITGIARYADELTEDETDRLEQETEDGEVYKVFETVISQRNMNGDPLNSTGDSGYIYNPDTVTMYKIEFGWYGAIGARFYAYIPQEVGEARWVTLHTLVIENQIGQPCLQDPFFFFKYRVFIESPAVLKLPQFVEKYGASYYIDGGDEGTVSIESGNASGRLLPEVTETDFPPTTTEFPIAKWGTVLGIKSKREIVNNEGSVIPNKKEIFPVSASIYSTRDTEIKFINQFGCRDHAYTFQESYKCDVKESQTFRGKFSINHYQRDPGALQVLGRDETAPVPTISYIGRVDAATYPESFDNLPVIGDWGSGSDEGWERNEGTLFGSHIIAEDVYGAYVNPKNQYKSSPTGFSGTEAILLRTDNDTVWEGSYRDNNWKSSQLLYKYKELNGNGDTVSKQIVTKLSNFRRDTTMISTVPIEADEFYIFFTSRSGELYDSVSAANSTLDTVACSQGAPGCDSKHVADYQIGVTFPRDISTEDPVASESQFVYPQSLLNRSLDGPEFGVLNPKETYAQNYNNNDSTGVGYSNLPVAVVQNDNGDWAVKDKTNPKPDNYLYYEGLPVDFEDPSLKTNVLMLNQNGRIHRSPDGLEVSEQFWDYLGEIDDQLPGVPGEDGGSCRALFCKVERQTRSCSVSIETVGGSTVIYLVSGSKWPEELGTTVSQANSVTPNPNAAFTLNLTTDPAGVFLGTVTSGGKQHKTVGAGNQVLWKLTITNPNGLSLSNGDTVEAAWNQLSIYETSLITKTAELHASKVVPATAFPFRVFVRFKDGAEIGSVIVGKNTSNGIVQLPFTPHGCTVSTSTDLSDQNHDGGSDGSNAATKHLQLFSQPDALVPALNHSYYDVTDTNPLYKPKKCASFISRTTLSGAGFSGVGDYPLRFLKFKDSGDPVGSFFISKDTPTEISLKELFNINGESVSPTFWGNKALFMIARDANLAGEAGTGRISVTLNYKEQ